MTRSILKLAVALLWIPAAVALDAWVLVTLWRWFVVPEFGARPLSCFGASGLSLLATYALVHIAWDKGDDEKGQLARSIVRNVAAALIVLGLGLLSRWMFAPGVTP